MHAECCVGGGKVVEEQWMSGPLAVCRPRACLGDFLVERRGALPPLGPSVQDKLPEFPTQIGPPRALTRWQPEG